VSLLEAKPVQGNRLKDRVNIGIKIAVYGKVWEEDK